MKIRHRLRGGRAGRARAAGVGAAISVAAGAHRRAVLRRQQHRRPGPHHRRQARRDLEAAGDRREPAGHRRARRRSPRRRRTATRIMLTSSGHPVANVINRAAPFDPVKDFAGITQVSAVPAALAVPPGLPANNVKEFLALARAKPGSLNFASAGTASTSYLAGEVFKQVAKIDIVHIPHKGAPEAMTSLLRNDFADLFRQRQCLGRADRRPRRSRRWRFSSAKRFPQLPNIPTVGRIRACRTMSTNPGSA